MNLSAHSQKRHKPRTQEPSLNAGCGAARINIGDCSFASFLHPKSTTKYLFWCIRMVLHFYFSILAAQKIVIRPPVRSSSITNAGNKSFVHQLLLYLFISSNLFLGTCNVCSKLCTLSDLTAGSMVVLLQSFTTDCRWVTIRCPKILWLLEIGTPARREGCGSCVTWGGSPLSSVLRRCWCWPKLHTSISRVGFWLGPKSEKGRWEFNGQRFVINHAVMKV